MKLFLIFCFFVVDQATVAKERDGNRPSRLKASQTRSLCSAKVMSMSSLPYNKEVTQARSFHCDEMTQSDALTFSLWFDANPNSAKQMHVNGLMETTIQQNRCM